VGKDVKAVVQTVMKNKAGVPMIVDKGTLTV
jgi:hypothetical protein